MGQLCEIKYMKGYFLYMIRIGVGLKILDRTPIPKLPTSYSPMPTTPPPKEIYTFLKMIPKSKVFNYQKNKWLFI